MFRNKICKTIILSSARGNPDKAEPDLRLPVSGIRQEGGKKNMNSFFSRGGMFNM